MAKKPASRTTKTGNAATGEEPVPAVELVPDDDHPDHVGELIEEGFASQAEHAALHGGDLSPMGSVPGSSAEASVPIWQPAPGPVTRPFPIPQPLNLCSPVSGRYRQIVPPLPPIVPPFGQPQPTPATQPVPQSLTPLNLIVRTVRVDVDRFFPQRRISIEVNRLIPQATAHAIAEVTSDQCIGYNNRRVTATITYRDGLSSLIPGTTVVFEAKRTTGRGYGAYSLNLSSGGLRLATYPLAFQSQYFDTVEFEVDRVANAGTAVTTYATASHPNRPADLPAETVSLATIYRRAGFEATMSPNTSVIPTSGAGANGTWSDSEMHNAMVTYWSRFANKPQWALWVLYAAQHDMGYSLGGIMFDDIGPNHRQGTAIFTNSFIQDAPAGDPAAAAWRQRMAFWTAVHEMGHAFNLAHSWQKALGTPWIPLANEPEARSFMNYPFNVAGGQAAFFADFRFRFSDSELVFMRHAPRRYVQMGNSNWFVNHGFEAPRALMQPSEWKLVIRPNREVNEYAFLEPVKLELKLTNEHGSPKTVEEDLLTEGKHIAVFVGREGGNTRQWNPFSTQCHLPHYRELQPGESIYGAHLISAATGGWLIDEPGFYKVQAAVDLGGEIVVSNVLRLFVAPPVSNEESKLAPDYFSEEVGRVIAFEGAPELAAATDTLREVAERCPENPAAKHASVTVSMPLLRDYKRLEAGADRSELAIKGTSADVEAAAKVQMEALVKAPDAAAETIGHIDYFADLERLASALEGAGDEKGAIKVLKSSIATMQRRGVIEWVVKETESKLAEIKV
jgi:hypothetical protein